MTASRGSAPVFNSAIAFSVARIPLPLETTRMLPVVADVFLVDPVAAFPASIDAAPRLTPVLMNSRLEYRLI
jgi:hypothetical protein